MYIVTLLVWLAGALAITVTGARRRQRSMIGVGLALGVACIAFFSLLGFWGELLWFEELGFGRRFWTEVLAKLGVGAAGALVAAAVVFALTLPVRHQVSRRTRVVGTVIAGAYGGAWGLSTWSLSLRWAMGVTTGNRDPVLGMDTGFYLFTLPLLDALYWLVLVSVLVAAAISGVSLALRIDRRSTTGDGSPALALALAKEESVAEASTEPSDVPAVEPDPSRAPSTHRGLFVTAGAFALVLAAGRLLAPYHLMYSRHGVVYGAGWTDVHVRLPVYYVTAAALALAGLVLMVPRATTALQRLLSRRFGATEDALAVATVATPAALIAGLWLLGAGALPPLSQWLVVQPNELALERPYLSHNIRFSREGFGLADVEIREFPVEGDLTPEVARDNDRLLSEVRLWDPHALDDVLEQFQELRLYYEVTKVDLDRYHLDGRYRQVLIAPREMEPGNLPAESQTFVNRHFKYTHGYGVVMAPVSDFTPAGLPNLVLRDLPPVAEYDSVAVTRAEIYYGERTNTYVVANSRATEFDYPAGGSNVYTHYEGAGGVTLDSFWRKLLFGWKLGGTRLLFSDYPKDDSRILFHRNIVERVATLAPFLELDEDPYTVVVDGRIKWILDAYTTSTHYPYSEPYGGGRAAPANLRAMARDGKTVEPAPLRTTAHPALDGVNYARNSVKAVVDAYDGSVQLYVFDEADPIVRVWSRIYPDLFRSKADMPPGLRAHVRYPETLLHTQGIVFAKYHMTDPTVFYNREDLWVRATEKYYDEVRPVEPYYVMWQAPGSSDLEFILMQPFTPKNRRVLIGWIAGMCDGDKYGKMVAYRFPKDKWILGPQQVDTKIDQDPALSAQLTLWDQHGKRVIRGNVLAIPIAKTILYVEPIYLQAQTAAYPELRMVVLMHGDDMSYAPTFADALEGLVSGRPAAVVEATGEAPSDVAAEASRAFEEYLRLTRAGQFAEAGRQLERLREALGKATEGGTKPLPAR